eukprot:SAG25_NODE_15_length_24441_cov_175.207288_4_plen_105_part_00
MRALAKPSLRTFLPCPAAAGGAGLYARSLMGAASTAEGDRGGKGSAAGPVELLDTAWRAVEAERVVGSCTAVLAVLRGQSLQTANLGDSGFMVRVSCGSHIFLF